ncbi:uncharacterized protein B0H64DRAFT_433585 [Chaetomium fimeti]|uniref:Uncharacterized protein n=1 Tax=Chaetomium fimeti TaxID=1854472 RepID=A0AAE0HDS4_9PEZI|nr:hypothetical protein B0H64DRAFT_433585 [Chaetomium fimeti]
MSTAYAPPPETAYLRNEVFNMPTNDGDVWAISFSTSSSQFLNGAIAVVFTLIFPWAWGLIAAAALYAAPKELTRRQSVGLVTLCNAPDPWTAFKCLLVFVYESVGTTKTWGDSVLGFVFGTIALGVFVVGIVMGIIGPPLLQIGNVAPVRSSILFYPTLPPVGDALGRELFNGHRSLGVLRALSSVEIARVTMRSKVEITTAPNATALDRNPSSQADPPEFTFALTYSYNLTGPDFGLEHASDLALSVSGACRADYTWLNETHPDRAAYDHYQLWGLNTLPPYRVALNGSSIGDLPRASFRLHPDAGNQLQKDGNVSYAILVTSAHRPSISAGSDPFYVTEPSDPNTAGANPTYAEWVRSGRPVLSCWQQDRWSYRGERVKNVASLKNVTDMAVPRVLLDVLEAALSQPLIVVIGPIAGPSALESVITSPGGFNTDGLIDANAASIQRDLERLIVASFVNTQNVFVDAALSEPSEGQKGLGNIFTGTDGQPRDGAGRFVVTTPDVQTFTLRGLIALAAVVVGLVLLKTLLMFKLILHADSHGDAANPPADSETPDGPGTGPGTDAGTRPPNDDRWARFKAFSAISLLRNVYEGGRGVPRDDWKCCEEFPAYDPDKSFRLVKCNHGACACGGHIETDRDAFPRQDPPTLKPPPAPENPVDDGKKG